MEKSIISILKSGSAVIYVLILCLVLALPVIFIAEAIKQPEFSLVNVSINEVLQEEITDGDSEGWKRVDFSLLCKAGKFSPYTYEITEFSATENEILNSAEDYRVVLDAPIYSDKDTDDSFVISVYVKSDSADLTRLIETISFRASDFTKSFGEFRLKFEDSKAQFFKK